MSGAQRTRFEMFLKEVLREDVLTRPAAADSMYHEKWRTSHCNVPFPERIHESEYS